MKRKMEDTKEDETTEFPEWTLHYHRWKVPFKGRGEFMRIMLEDKGIEYKDTGENLHGPKGLCCASRGTPEQIKAEDTTSFPVFFPPMLRHRPADGGEEVIINQVAACMIYLGECLGYYPSSPAERARANAILMNAQDYIAEGRISFHPVKNSMSYNDQKEEGDKCSKEFSKGRMLLWLAFFDKIVSGNKIPASPIAGGSDVTYADFALFHVLDATVFQFDTDFYEKAWSKFDCEPLKAYYAWMKDRPNIKAYQASDRCPAFSGNSMM